MNDNAAEVQQRPAAGAVALAAQRLLPGLREDFVHFVGQRLPVRGVAGGFVVGFVLALAIGFALGLADGVLVAFLFQYAMYFLFPVLPYAMTTFNCGSVPLLPIQPENV